MTNYLDSLRLGPDFGNKILGYCDDVRRQIPVEAHEYLDEYVHHIFEMRFENPRSNEYMTFKMFCDGFRKKYSGLGDIEIKTQFNPKDHIDYVFQRIVQGYSRRMRSMIPKEAKVYLDDYVQHIYELRYRNNESNWNLTFQMFHDRFRLYYKKRTGTELNDGLKESSVALF